MSNYNGSKLNIIQSITKILSNLAVLIGIIFGLLQFNQSISSEKRMISIDALNEIRTNDFLKAYTKLKTDYINKSNEYKVSRTDDLNYLMNIYNNIAILYFYNVADRKIIKNSIGTAIQEVSEMITYFKYPEEYKKNFDTLKSKLLNN